MPRKFSWLTFFIFLFSTSSICLLFIPYQETKHLDQGYPIEEHNYSQISFNAYHMIELPWRSFNQEIYFNVSVYNATISLQILVDPSDFVNFFMREPYGSHWEVNNITIFENTIQITPSIQGLILIVVTGNKSLGNSTSILLYSGITVYYLRYASSYGLVFLGVAVILISSYGYRRYRWR
ncbi:hypothetical protein LCGC14_0961580 [marine sediment metagenome]|uniref:Uncharacterized protein n=1 Tax=marine sediment metagenome TaxID=412755 RepID=A0A0F9RKX2_9ZZZZ